MEKNFYVGISEPKEVRKNILEASKEFLQALQGYEQVKDLREEKQKAIWELKGILAEVSAKIPVLRTELPHYKISELPKKEAVQEKPKAIIPKPIKTTPKKSVQTRKLVKQRPSKQQPTKQKQQPKKAAKKEVKPKSETNLERLQRELSSIESKLKGL